MVAFSHNDDETSTRNESFTASPSNTGMAVRPLVAVSSCSSSSSGSSGKTGSDGESTLLSGSDGESTLFSAAIGTVSSAGGESQTAFMSCEDDDTTIVASSSCFGQYYNGKESLIPPKGCHSTLSTRSKTSTKLSLRLDDVRRLARLGRNATIRKKCRLPASISKADIHVQLDIDECARAGSSGGLEETIRDAIQDDLSTVYSADARSAKLILCIVVVVVADGSFLRTLSDRDGVIGLAEIGLAWRLFEADDLTVYDGGLVVQTEEVATRILDFITFTNTGRACLLNRLVPRVANDIMSRIADANEDLLVEI